MNIFLMAILLSLVENAAVLPTGRGARRAARQKAIHHNARVYHDLIGYGIWFEEPDEDGVYRRWASGQQHTNKQQGRWATERLSGHRRMDKWLKDYYGSPEVALDKYFQRIDKRWEERYGE